MASARTSRDKHGIRSSNTAALFLEDVYVDADRLVGGEEGKGCNRRRLFSTSASWWRPLAWAAGQRSGHSLFAGAHPGGAPLSQKQGYTHKLIVPNAVRLEAARAYIEWAAERIDRGGQDLQTEALSPECGDRGGNKAAEDCIKPGRLRLRANIWSRDQAMCITTIYEGVGDHGWTIARERWQLHLKSRGAYYNDWADRLERVAAKSRKTAPA